MDATVPPQRVDIAQVVGEFQGKSPRRALRDAEAAAEPPRDRSREVPAGPWFAGHAAILQGRVTLQAWAWPRGNRADGQRRC